MSTDPFTDRRHKALRSNDRALRSPFSYADLASNRPAWLGSARVSHGHGVPLETLREFVQSQSARQALQAFDGALAQSVFDTYKQATQQYLKWEVEVLRRRLRQTEQERSKLEQDNEDLRRALEATRKLESRDLRTEFNELAEQWRDETGHMSSAISFTQHPAYLRIIAMGPAVVPFILEDLARTQSHWFVALRLITGENPVKPDDKGSVQRITDAWITWGRERGLV